MADIELVIKIPSEIYEDIKKHGLCGYCSDREIVSEAIANGTLLPKGHGRLIDADAYKEKIFRVFPCNDRDDQNIRRSTEMTILSAPTIIEADKGE